MRPKVSMREALSDPLLFAPILPGPSWLPWRTILIGLMGEVLTDEERELWRLLTSRDREPSSPVEEFWAIVGRRGGKTRSMSVLSAYLSALCDWSDLLVPGERGKLPYLAASQKQAAVAFGYAAAIFEQVSLLRAMVKNETKETIELDNGIDLEIRAASFRGLRGITAIGAICDEISFFRTAEDSANPDSEILTALRPSLATTNGPLIAISSPYAKRGELYATFKSHFGPTGDPAILVAKGASRTFNPSLPQKVVDRALQRDAASASAEYLAEFRSDIEAFIKREQVEGLVSSAVFERPYVPFTSYTAFTDPSGGAADAWTLAIVHREDDMVILDAIREHKPPFSPERVVADLSDTLISYGLSEVMGDRYGGEFPRELFSKAGVTYLLAPKSRSDIYREILPSLNSGTVDLLDNDKLVNQFVGLERRVTRGTGKEQIDHSPGSHDDVANSVAGAIWAIDNAPQVPQMGIGRYGGGADEEEDNSMFSGMDYVAEQRRRGLWNHD
ncbi:hypothetical protein [Mesorhizobium sp. M0159]|uniref:hypothetical protein n=1 Tax=Mesorhizobium sp. M0159 TaxID=2956900 RepID=UPI00333968B9